MSIQISDSEFFIGLCLLLSAQSNDDPGESCIVAKGKKIISSGYSSTSLLGTLEGCSEKFAVGSISLPHMTNCDVYVDHTPDPIVLSYLSRVVFKRLVYLDTGDISTEEASLLKAKVVRFQGNLNWMRDYIDTIKDLGIFN